MENRVVVFGAKANISQMLQRNLVVKRRPPVTKGRLYGLSSGRTTDN